MSEKKTATMHNPLSPKITRGKPAKKKKLWVMALGSFDKSNVLIKKLLTRKYF